MADLVAVVEQAGYTARPVVARPPSKGDAHLQRRLVVAVVAMIPLGDRSVLFSVSPSARFPGWQWLLPALAAPVIGWSALPFLRAAARAARHATTSMDTLVSVGVLAATCWSMYEMFLGDAPLPGGTVWSILWQPRGALYLDIAAGVTTFVLAGRYFEARARGRAADALRTLAVLGARDVCVLAPDGTEKRIPVERLAVGQRLVVRPGERIATADSDHSGASTVDMSAMTGESGPAITGGRRVGSARMAL